MPVGTPARVSSSIACSRRVAIDPLMVDYAIQPMSDVPAACWLLAAVWLRLERPKWPEAAGICAGMRISLTTFF